MRSNRQLRGHHRISAGGSRGPTPQNFSFAYGLIGIANEHFYDVKTILSPRDRMLIVLDVKGEIDFQEFMQKNYSRLIRHGFEFYFLEGSHSIPDRVQQIIDAVNDKRKGASEIQRRPTGWESYSGDHINRKLELSIVD